jgi:hypothetical protein
MRLLRSRFMNAHIRFKLVTLPFERRAVTIGLGLIALFVFAFGLFLRSTPDAFPYGDSAVIEVYVLEALRGFVNLGPYSQYGWHHPGPLYFYLLIPFYELAGHRAIGLTAGAIAINFGR